MNNTTRTIFIIEGVEIYVFDENNELSEVLSMDSTGEHGAFIVRIPSETYYELRIKKEIIR